jgi:cytochrome P450
MPSDRIGPLQALADNYGDISMFRIGPRRIFFLNHPDLIQECLLTKHKSFHKAQAYWALTLVMGNGLVTSEADFHHRQRRMMQPAFHKERLAAYANIMIDYARRTGEEWRDGARVDMVREMNRMTLNIVGKALFNSDVDSQTGVVGEALDTLMNMDAVFLNPFGPLIAKLPLPINARRKAATRRLDEVLYSMIDDHRKKEDQGDLLSMLLAAQDEDDGTRMTDKQVRDEAVTLFLAGHETTANALTWTWMLLAQHPEIEAKVHQEIGTVLEGRAPTVGDYPRLPYCKQVLSEAMRVYPPVWSIGRMAVEDTTLGDHPIRRGDQVISCQYITHRDPRFWPDPDRFDPDRFKPENCTGRHKFAYFPFGGGKRLCIGEGFAWMEGVLCLAALAQQWQCRLDPGHEVRLDPHITLRPKGGMPMTLIARHKQEEALAS